MNYPDLETYRKLYARYIERNGRSVEQMLDLVGVDFKDKRVLDLCGGGGEASVGALKRGADYVLLIDECEDMVDFDNVISYKQIEYGRYHINEWLEDFWYTHDPFDIVLCRQGINYWMDEAAAGNLAKMMNDGGVFVFNTFNKQPGYIPNVKQYEFNHRKYLESSWLDLDDETVHHVQCCQGLPPHTTSFKWIPMMVLEDWLEPHFKVSREQDIRTELFRCVKK